MNQPSKCKINLHKQFLLISLIHQREDSIASSSSLYGSFQSNQIFEAQVSNDFELNTLALIVDLFGKKMIFFKHLFAILEGKY